MFRRLLATALALAIMCLCGAAQAGGAPAGGKNAHLVPQDGEYAPRYSVSPVFEVLPGTEFTIVAYEDSGTAELAAARNGGGMPSGTALTTRARDGVRQACISGVAYAEGTYVFSMLVQERQEDDAQPLRTLAILHVTLKVTADAKVVEEYLGDGAGMLRIAVDGVNFRRTPGGTRLCQYDEGRRMVWCSTQEKGGYTWYRVWTEDFGYGWVRGDMVQVEPPIRIVYTPGKETAYALFITPGVTSPLTPSLIMTEAPEEIGFDAEPLAAVVRGGDTWTLLRFCIAEEKAFWIKADLRNEDGAPLECQLVYLTTRWEEIPEYVNH